MHREYRPIQINSWVDDLFQLHTGPKDFILEHARQAARTLAELLNDKKLSISPKSTITASSQEIAVSLRDKLKEDRIKLQVEQAAKNLGTDFCGGKRRIIPVQQMRLTGAAAAGSVARLNYV